MNGGRFLLNMCRTSFVVCGHRYVYLSACTSSHIPPPLDPLLATRRLLSNAATLRPNAAPQLRSAAEASLSLAIRMGVPSGDVLAALLDSQHGEVCVYGS